MSAPEQPEVDEQRPYVLGMLREQADILTAQVVRTTQQAGEARATAERLDEEAAGWQQRADVLNSRADRLGDELAV